MLKMAPKTALKKKTFEGEKRSVMVNIAKIKVPEIKPNCTAEVRLPSALTSRLKLRMSSLKIPLLANHKEVQQNWAMTIVGKIRLVEIKMDVID